MPNVNGKDLRAGVIYVLLGQIELENGSKDSKPPVFWAVDLVKHDIEPGRVELNHQIRTRY